MTLTASCFAFCFARGTPMNDYNDDYFQLLQLHEFKSLKPPLGETFHRFTERVSLTMCLSVQTNLPIDSDGRFFPFRWPYFFRLSLFGIKKKQKFPSSLLKFNSHRAHTRKREKNRWECFSTRSEYAFHHTQWIQNDFFHFAKFLRNHFNWFCFSFSQLFSSPMEMAAVAAEAL